MSTNILLENSWKKFLLPYFSEPYMLKLKQFLLQQKQHNKIIYPKGPDIFNAFAFTPIDQVQVVLLGQDPYHGVNQAHGLCFSVPYNVKLPPSLINIYKELKYDLNISPANHGCLIKWAKQGVLLLNSILTVEAGLAGSHHNKGWELFTDQVIKLLNDYHNQIIFLLWGAYAANKCSAIDINKHFVLKAAHPSPLSANKGFFGCKHFSKTNQILRQLGKEPIDWDLNDKVHMV